LSLLACNTCLNGGAAAAAAAKTVWAANGCAVRMFARPENGWLERYRAIARNLIARGVFYHLFGPYPFLFPVPRLFSRLKVPHKSS